MDFNPSNLLDVLQMKLDLKNDAALSRALEVSPPLLSKMRSRKLPVSAGMLIRMHEVSGLSVGELRQFMGDRRKQIRVGNTLKNPSRGNESMLDS